MAATTTALVCGRAVTDTASSGWSARRMRVKVSVSSVAALALFRLVNWKSCTTGLNFSAAASRPLTNSSMKAKSSGLASMSNCRWPGRTETSTLPPLAPPTVTAPGAAPAAPGAPAGRGAGWRGGAEEPKSC